MNDLTVTVAGWVATEPKSNVGPTGVRVTSFRLASTSRYFDRDKGEWVDGRTEWFTVRTFRSGAITVLNSIHKGQPVLVTGRFRTSDWESDAGTRTDLNIDAASVGHDLTRGTATFHRGTGDESLGERPGEAAVAPVEDDVEGAEVSADDAEELALTA